ncbi:MAG: PqqD family protein [bacterium]|nr:MAG: PqqD family protein [bacterium]
MGKGKNKKKAREVNLLDLIPLRTAEFEVDDDTNLVTILTPRVKNRLLKKLLEPRLKNPMLKIKLDEIGSAVWLQIDGKRNVKEIGMLLRERFKEKIEPCFDRLGLFFQQLEHQRFISYLNLEACRKVMESSQGAADRDSPSPSS